MKQTSTTIAVAATFVAAFISVPVAADPGRNLASACANCHGTNGHSLGGVPSLAGQNKIIMLQALREFRDGKRPATIMHQLAKGYTDAQLDLVSDYFSRQPAAR